MPSRVPEGPEEGEEREEEEDDEVPCADGWWTEFAFDESAQGWRRSEVVYM